MVRSRIGVIEHFTYQFNVCDNDKAVAVQLCVSFPRVCLARARNPESSAWVGKRSGILRAAATRENDRASNSARRETVTMLCRTQFHGVATKLKRQP